MAFIESHQSLARHPKTKRAARLLGVSLPQMIGHLHCLWWWALDFAQDGNLSGFVCEEIADEAMWEGEAARFIEVVIEVGFLERNHEGQLCIHDWYDYAGKLIEKRMSDAERKRSARSNKEAPRMSTGHPTDIRGMSQVTVPYPTVSITPLTPQQPEPDTTPVEQVEEKPVDNFTPLFEWFLAHYPFRDGKKLYQSKIKAALKLIKPRDWELLETCVTNFAASSQAKRNYAPDAHRWLSGSDWKVWAEPEKPGTHTNGAAPIPFVGRAPTRDNTAELEAILGISLDTGKPIARAGPLPAS